VLDDPVHSCTEQYFRAIQLLLKRASQIHFELGSLAACLKRLVSLRGGSQTHRIAAQHTASSVHGEHTDTETPHATHQAATPHTAHQNKSEHAMRKNAERE
jgi:hypothetical protein